MAITSSITRWVKKGTCALPCWALTICGDICPFIPTRSSKIILEDIFLWASAIAIGCGLATRLLGAQIAGRAGDSPR